MKVLNLLIDKLSGYQSKTCLYLQMLTPKEKNEINNIMDILSQSSDPDGYQACIIGADALNASELIESGNADSLLPTEPY